MKLTVVVAVAAGALLSGCPPIETTIDSDPQTVTVPGQGILNGNPLAPDDVFPADVIGQALAQSVQQSFDTSGYDKSRVSSLTLTKLHLEVTNPQQGGGPAAPKLNALDFIESIGVSLGAPGAPILAAQSNPGDFDSQPFEYDVPLTDAELAEAFKSSDALEMTADVVPDDPPQDEAELEITSSITVQIVIF